MQYFGLINSGIMGFIMILANILLIILLSHQAINDHSITIGQLITFLALSSQIFSSVSSILSENLNIQENEVILTRYYDFGKNEKLESAQAHVKIQTFSINTVEFRNVSFHYNPQKPVFSNLNIIIEKGDKINFKGSNGAGKSTFCKLLSLLYAPDSGDILINNEKLLFYNTAAIRKKILLVSNEDVLFNDTIGYNITFNYNANTERILSLAKDIGLYDFISSNDNGLDFIITEQGKNLSTGQRKKILLMRALLSDAEIILLDETLSGIDMKSKEKIEHYLNNEADRSFIIISHEPLDILNFSKTLILNNGSIELLQYEWA
jgi:subfamily B ATP-binding cassette protein HlyB/CyaB